MKVLAVGDLHGKDVWKSIDANQYETIVFIGDYVDSFTVLNEPMIRNLEELIAFKDEHNEKVILLLGNHDIQYLDYPHYQCSGFRRDIQSVLTRFYNNNRNKFQVAWQVNNWLFTHAGVTNTFFQKTFKTSPLEFLKTGESLAEKLNELQNSDDQWKLHVVSSLRGGYHPYSGITWADLRESSVDYLPGYHQVVGHTPIHEFLAFSKPGPGELDSSITYIDVLDKVTKFYEVEI